MKPGTIPPILERYELKYHIPVSMVRPIADFASIYCSPDPHTLASPTGYYRVNNLYFDSPNFLFLRMRQEGAESRFNVRVRSYGDTPELPYFLEIKQKIGQVIRKYRAKVHDPDWHQVFTRPGHGFSDSEADAREMRNLRLFERVIYSYQARPVVFTQYLRNAWISDVDDYARVTFDMNLRYMEERGFDLVPREDALLPCDPQVCFDPGCSVILELKCYTSSVPVWMIDMIRQFQLQRRSFSKYLTGARELFQSQQGFSSRVALV